MREPWRAAWQMSALAALGLFCAVADAGAQSAAYREATSAIRCMLAAHWCVYVKRDPITRQRTRSAMVRGQGAIFNLGISSSVTLTLACADGKPALYVLTGNAISYQPFGLRYRVDPGGRIGQAVAMHVQSADVFAIRDSDAALREMAGGKRMTVEFIFADGGRTTSRFDIDGMADVKRRLGCQR